MDRATRALAAIKRSRAAEQKFMTVSRQMYDNLRARKFRSSLSRENLKALAKKQTTKQALGWEECLLHFSLGFFRIELSKVLDAKKTCRYCGVPLKIGNVSPDHRIPIVAAEEFAATLIEGLDLEPGVKALSEDGATLARIGVHNFGNIDLECCSRCNTRKGDLTSNEFLILCQIVTGMPTRASRYIFTKLGSVPFRWHQKGAKDAATADKK